MIQGMADHSETPGWPIWKCAALTAILCAIPLVPAFIVFPVVAVIVWAILIAIYVALVKLFGEGFIVAGAIIVLILAVFFFLLAPRFLQRPGPEERTAAWADVTPI